MGRRATGKSTITASFCIPKELLSLVDEKADNLHISRSTLISAILEQNIRKEGLECLKLEKITEPQ